MLRRLSSPPQKVLPSAAGTMQRLDISWCVNYVARVPAGEVYALKHIQRGFLQGRSMLSKLFLSDMQRGFLQGRSMLSNIIDVDFHAMKISLLHSGGAAVLFDFEAAFPSLSQEFMWTTLEHINVAPGPLQDQTPLRRQQTFCSC